MARVAPRWLGREVSLTTVVTLHQKNRIDYFCWKEPTAIVNLLMVHSCIQIVDKYIELALKLTPEENHW